MNRWDSKRIAFISILIAMSISFVIIGTRMAALTSIPSLKLSVAGLPIKIIGYVFGPITGFVVGFVTDIISFAFIPTFYYPMYSIALGVSGAMPGVMALFYNFCYKRISKERMLRKLNEKRVFLINEKNISLLKENTKKLNKVNNKYLKLNQKIDKITLWKDEKYQLNFGLISGTTLLMLVLIGLISFVIVIPQQTINESFDGILKLIRNKIIFIVVIGLGVGICIFSLVFTRFKMKSTNYLSFVPIVVFIIFTEFINIPIIAYADEKALKTSFVASAIVSLATSFIKIWFNTIVISFAIRIVLPLINKKTFNGYE